MYVNGAWRFVDQFWGSQSITLQEDAEWALVHAGGATEVQAEQDRRIHYNLNSEWFLPDPVRFVYSHLVENPDAQLLARPVTLDEFNEMAFLQPGYFTLNLTSLSHPRCIIRCTDGTLSISLGLSQKEKLPYRFFHNMYKSIINPKIDRLKGRQAKDFSVKYSTSDSLNIHIEFPWIGRYKLNVEGEIYRRHQICQYIIQVERPCFRAEPIPSLPEGEEELGLTAVVRALGLSAVDDGIHGVVTAKRGEASMKFRIANFKDESLKLRPHMEGDHVIRQYYDRNGNINIVTKVTKHGKHLLCIDVQKKEIKTTIR